MSGTADPLEDVLNKAIEESDGDEITVGSMLDAFGDRAFGPLIAILALIVITPIGAIPGLPIAFGLVIILVAAQILFGRDHPWVPDRLEEIGFAREKAERFRGKAQPTLAKIDTLIRPRLEWAAGSAARLIAAVCCIGLSALFVPLAVVPWGVMLPAFALLGFGVALTARDGVVMVLSFALTAASAYFAWQWA